MTLTDLATADMAGLMAGLIEDMIDVQLNASGMNPAQMHRQDGFHIWNAIVDRLHAIEDARALGREAH